MHPYTVLGLTSLAGFALAGQVPFRNSKVAKLPEEYSDSTIGRYNVTECKDIDALILKTATTDLTWRDPDDPNARATWWNTFVPDAWGKNVDSPWVLYCQASGRNAYYTDKNTFNNFAQTVSCSKNGTGTFDRKPQLLVEGLTCTPRWADISDDPNGEVEKTCGCKYVESLGGPATA